MNASALSSEAPATTAAQLDLLDLSQFDGFLSCQPLLDSVRHPGGVEAARSSSDRTVTLWR
jgi:hypothetical protein